MNDTQPMMGVCKQCGALRHLHAKCMCHRCYLAWWRRHRQGTCQQCGQQGFIYKATGQCESCYKRVWYQQHKRQGECRECGRMMRLHCKDLCVTCYRKSISAYGKCSQCGEQKLLPFDHKTMCAACSSRRQHNKPQPTKPLITAMEIINKQEVSNEQA